MDKIKIINPKDSTDYFEIPWEWLPQGTQGPTLNDLEATAERGKSSGYLSRVRCAEIPAATLDIDERLTQQQIYPMLKLLKLVKVKIYYFEKYLNKFVTRDFYAKKPNPKYWEIPENNNTDNIVYDKFTIEFSGYGDVN